MKTIDIDIEVFDKLKKIAVPFVDTTPNMVIRRLLGLSRETQDEIQSSKVNSSSKSTRRRRIVVPDQKHVPGGSSIDQLGKASPQTHPAFLTFLMDKKTNRHGNYKTSEIISFMEEVNLVSISGAYRNPWMNAPYGGEKNGRISCQRTIEHFKQTRKFGCWNGKDIKVDCDADNICIYHPNHPDEIKNKCDLRKGVIWKRANPESSFTYGAHYIDVVEKELLEGRAMPLKPLLAVFYPDRSFSDDLIEEFKRDFNFNENKEEMDLFSYNLD